MKRNINLLLASLSYFTVLPTWKIAKLDESSYNRSLRYFPFTGAVVGVVSASAYWVSSLLFSSNISIILSMVASILFTRAIHEDGFSDLCDGFGGGFTKDRVLEIMKDSSVGAFGAIGILLMLGLKFLSLGDIPETLVIPTTIAAHSISRQMAISFIYTLDYARTDSSSKSKIILTKYTIKDLIINIICGWTPIIWLIVEGNIISISVVIPLLLIRYYLAYLFKKRIDGYTGDTLGAAQQIFEVVIYLTIGALALN